MTSPAYDPISGQPVYSPGPNLPALDCKGCCKPPKKWWLWLWVNCEDVEGWAIVCAETAEVVPSTMRHVNCVEGHSFVVKIDGVDQDHTSCSEYSITDPVEITADQARRNGATCTQDGPCRIGAGGVGIPLP